MKEKLLAAIAALPARFRPALEIARAHRLWVEFGAVTLLALVAVVSFGSAALARTAALHARAEELRAVERGMAGWRTGLRAPAPAESLAWRESERALSELGGGPDTPLTVARMVAQRAEEAGIEQLHIGVFPADSVLPVAPLQLGGWSVGAQGDGLLVEFDGDMADVIGFLGTLPTQAAVSKLEIATLEDRLHARVVLLTRTATRP